MEKSWRWNQSLVPKEEDLEDAIQSPCRKRSRIKEEDPDDLININKLPDAMLSEILYRLPCRLALQCKSLSKRWFSLVSDPYFICGFIDHHSDCSSQPFNLLLQNKLNYFTCRKDIKVFPSNNSDLPRRNYFLKFLNPDFGMSIQASFNDLVLVFSKAKRKYHICNPLIREWLTLPRPPIEKTNSFMAGFICDSYSRYKVVRIYNPSKPKTTQLEMEIFCSETGKWRNSVVSSPRELNFSTIDSMRTGVVACNGMLHWLDTCYNDELNVKVKGIVVFDPFNDTERCLYIDPPINYHTPEGYNSIGMFQGRLRILQFACYPHVAVKATRFSVWELEDYSNAGTWCMKHEVYFDKIVSEERFTVINMDQIQRPYLPLMNFVAFHPNDGELVFFQFLNYLVLCNMQTKVLNIAGTIPYDYICSFHLLLQTPWPTPIHSSESTRRGLICRCHRCQYCRHRCRCRRRQCRGLLITLRI
jgi:F-box interacting protein